MESSNNSDKMLEEYKAEMERHRRAIKAIFEKYQPSEDTYNKNKQQMR